MMTIDVKRLRKWAAAWVAGLALVAGCGDDPKKPAETGGSGKTPATAPATLPADAPRPGFATGTVLREDGKPIAIEKSRVEVVVRGVSHDTNDEFTLTPAVRPDGSYEVALPRGTVRFVSAIIEVPFDVRQFRFDLFPVQDNKGGRESKEGIRQDFVWKVSGLRPGQRADETKASVWYGGAIDMIFQNYRDDLQKEVPPAPRGTKVVFTLTPITPLVDGREGKPRTFERSYRGLGLELDNKTLADLPLATYQLAAHEVYPDGKQGKLILFDPRDKKWKDVVDGSFGSDLEKHALVSVRVTFTRPM